MAYLDYVGLAYFKSLLDENYLRTNYEGDTVIDGNVTFTNPVDASVKNDWLGQQIDKTYLKDVVPDPEGSGALALILGDGTVSHLITDTTVTQVRSNANELYPILLCYDASAEEDQIAKKVWYGNGVRINPRYGYLYSQKMLTLHPTYNRAAAPTSRVEWTSDFRDSVLNPVGQVFEYIDPVSSGGEHRMEFRLYGNPNVAGINTPNINDETNIVSLGVSATRGDALTFFGYAPSTPIYLEDGSTMRKSLVRGDQYGKDIITRDWLNLNGSITGLVHTYMDETIDGYKTFLKTVTIDSGDNNNKAGLNVQGDVNIDSGDDSNPSNLHVQGDGDIDGDLNVDGNSHIHGNEVVDGNETIHGDLTIDSGDPNDPSHIYVQGEIYHPSENGEDPVEYISYITNQQEFRTEIVEHLLPIGKGLAKDSEGKIYVDFSQIDEATKADILSGLDVKIPLTSNRNFYVNKDSANATTVWKTAKGTLDVTVGTVNKPFKTVQSAVDCVTQAYDINSAIVNIIITKGSTDYVERINLPTYSRTTGYIQLKSANETSSANFTVIRSTLGRGYNEDETIVETSGTAGTIVVIGTGWNLKHLHIKRTSTLITDGDNHFDSVIIVENGGQLNIKNCLITQDYSGNATSSADKNNSINNTYMRVVTAYNQSQVYFMSESNIDTIITGNRGNATGLDILFAERSSQILTFSHSESNYSRNVRINGSNADSVLTAIYNSQISCIVGQKYTYNIVGNITGKSCHCSESSFVFIWNDIGTSAGDCEAESYSWVKPSSLLS